MRGEIVEASGRLQACLAMRYRVYCQERGFLREADYPELIEADDFDAHAMHLAVLDSEGSLLGTARLIRDSGLGFPLQRYCRASIPSEIRATTAEVSRLAIPRSHRSRYCGYPMQPGQRGLAGDITLKLFLTVFRAAKVERLTHLMAAMEESLVRLLGSYGVEVSPIGPVADYAGPVRPYLMALNALELAVERVSEALDQGCASCEPAEVKQLTG